MKGSERCSNLDPVIVVKVAGFKATAYREIQVGLQYRFGVSQEVLERRKEEHLEQSTTVTDSWPEIVDLIRQPCPSVAEGSYPCREVNPVEIDSEP